MFAPPVNRAMKVLDRSFFQKTVPTSAARIFNPKDISRCRKELERGKDFIGLSRISPVQPDPSDDRATKGGKCILLRPDVLHNDPSTWSSQLRALSDDGTLGVIPYQLHLDYNFFTYSEVMSAIVDVSTNAHDELPTGFSMAGHVAHLNLREKYLPYKHLIATVLADKNPNVRTVINKLDTVGTENEFRTFQYEVLHGPDDMNVTLHEQGCTFQFDFAKVYWNSRLHTEHERLCSLFNPGEAVCDVMAGIGPFAVPAGRNHVFVWANDLNPESHKYLVDAIRLNKVGDFVRPFNQDGHAFIRTATASLLQTTHTVPIYPKKPSRSAPKPTAPPEPLKTYNQPQLFSHYVMNLPASSLTFLPSFIGLYSRIPSLSSTSIRQLFHPFTDRKLPMIHAYCFSTKSDDNVAETAEICAEISRQLEHEIRPDSEDVQIYDVRDVAPKKRMFCASFRLPEEVAFREV